MNSLESARIYIEKHLQETSKYDNDLFKALLIYKEDFYWIVYNAFYDVIANISQTPKDIVHQLDTYTSGLEGFSADRPLQSLVAFVCLEALANRKPKVLTGPWEKLLWIIVKNSLFATRTQTTVSFSFNNANAGVVKWVTRYSSQKLCPNPCLRLELFRFMGAFNSYKECFSKLFRENVITTLFELCYNYKSLPIEQLPNFCPIDLQLLIQDSYISIGYIINEYELNLKKSEIIVAILTLTKMFALLEKERQAHDYADYFDLETQLSVCLSFCGLVPFIHDGDIDYDDEWSWFIEEVNTDPLLMNYVIDTLDTITQVSLSFPENTSLHEKVSYKKGRMLHRFLKSHIKKLPKHNFFREINGGGLGTATEDRLRYFQNNMVCDDRDSENDSDSEENGYRSFNTEESDIEEDLISEEEVVSE